MNDHVPPYFPANQPSKSHKSELNQRHTEIFQPVARWSTKPTLSTTGKVHVVEPTTVSTTTNPILTDWI